MALTALLVLEAEPCALLARFEQRGVPGVDGGLAGELATTTIGSGEAVFFGDDTLRKPAYCESALGVGVGDEPALNRAVLLTTITGAGINIGGSPFCGDRVPSRDDAVLQRSPVGTVSVLLLGLNTKLLSG